MKQFFSRIITFFKKDSHFIIYLFAVAAFQILTNTFLFSHIFKGISFFCGDSAYYVYLANNLNAAAADRPSGFPFLLNLLFRISEKPMLLMMFGTIVSVFTGIFAFLTIKYLLKNKNNISLLITLFFFLNPVIWTVSTMIYMSDAFAFLLFVIGIYLILSNKNKNSLIAAAFIFGYLTIVRSVFVYLFPIILAYIFYVLSKARMPFKKNLSIITIVMIAFLIIPIAYSYIFVQPRLGTVSIENFSGRSTFGNMLPFLSCKQLASIATSQRELDAIKNYCNDDEIRNSSADEERWIETSSMNKMEKALVYDGDRVKGNRIFKKWVLSLAIKYPSSVYYPIKNTIINGYLNNVIAKQISISEPPQIDGGCELLVEKLLKQDKSSYLAGWKSYKEKSIAMYDFISKFETLFTIITHWIIVCSLILIPIIGLYKKIFLSEAVFLYLIAVVYAVLVSLGSCYDNRYFILFDYLIILSLLASLMSKKEIE